MERLKRSKSRRSSLGKFRVNTFRSRRDSSISAALAAAEEASASRGLPLEV